MPDLAKKPMRKEGKGLVAEEGLEPPISAQTLVKLDRQARGALYACLPVWGGLQVIPVAAI
jgi:hypothetical protein